MEQKRDTETLKNTGHTLNGLWKYFDLKDETFQSPESYYSVICGMHV